MRIPREGWTPAFRWIVEDDHSRRELLWLDAKEKDDRARARTLEGRDPGIKARLWFFHDVSFAALDVMPEEGRRHAYREVYDAHLDWLLGRDRCHIAMSA